MGMFFGPIFEDPGNVHVVPGISTFTLFTGMHCIAAENLSMVVLCVKLHQDTNVMMALTAFAGASR